MKSITSVDEIKIGTFIHVMDDDFGIDFILMVESIVPAPEYGSSVVVINDEYVVDPFQQDVYEM